MLKEILAQNATMLERLDDAAAQKLPAPVTQTVNISHWAVFWEAAFSIWGLFIVIIVCVTLTQLITGQPLFK